MVMRNAKDEEEAERREEGSIQRAQ